MLKRSAAQKEVAALKESLAKAQDALTVQQQQLKQLQLRERLRLARHEDEDEDEDGGGGIDVAAVESEQAHLGLGLLLLSNELTLLERAWMSEKGAAAELVAIKANMSFRVAQVEDDNQGLQAEVTRLKARIAALQEEKEVMQGSLNVLNNDLSQQSVEQQQSIADSATAAAAAIAQPPPPPPPPRTMSMPKSLKGMNMPKFGKKRASEAQAQAVPQ